MIFTKVKFASYQGQILSNYFPSKYQNAYQVFAFLDPSESDNSYSAFPPTEERPGPEGAEEEAPRVLSSSTYNPAMSPQGTAGASGSRHAVREDDDDDAEDEDEEQCKWHLC